MSVFSHSLVGEFEVSLKMSALPHWKGQREECEINIPSCGNKMGVQLRTWMYCMSAFLKEPPIKKSSSLLKYFYKNGPTD